LCSGSGVVACNQHVHITTASGSGCDGVQGGAFDGGVVVFCNDESGHGLSFVFV
jgi:hypothetical protein